MSAIPKTRLLISLFLILGALWWAGCTSQAPAPEKDTIPTPPEEKELIVNGGFEQGIEGWTVGGGWIKTEDNGNKYLAVGHNWQVYQILNLEPNAFYDFQASTRKGIGNEEVRFKLIFFDVHAQRLGYYNMLYGHLGKDWERIPVQEIKVPEGSNEAILYILSNGIDDTHAFDDISLIKTGESTEPVVEDAITVALNAAPERLKNNGFDHNFGWSATALDKVKKSPEGNNYLVNGYNWDAYQSASIIPEKSYKFQARTRKGDAQGPARFVIIFLDKQLQKLPSTQNISYQHQGTDWEQIPETVITAPENAEKVVVYLLSNDPNGRHHFDDIYFTQQ